MQIKSKLPNVGTTIFTTMSALANQHQAINLSQGFPNFDCSERLKKLVFQYMEKGYNQYAPMAGVPDLRYQIAQKVKKLYEADIDPNTEITITAGATQALFTALAAFVRPGDEIILIEPAYDCYKPAIELNGGIPVAYELKAPDFRIDWKVLATLVNEKTKAIMLNTPHNPSGRTLKAADLQQLEQLVAGKEIMVISDEVYEHLVFDDLPHESILRYPKLREQFFATYSFGKTFHNTGWKVGYCIGPEPLMAEFRKVHQYNVFSVNTPVQYALAEFLQDESEYLSLNSFYQAKRDRFLPYLEQSRFEPIPCEGTYFQLAKYSNLSDEPDTAFTQRLIVENGIATIPISVFYSSGLNEHIVRFCFAKTDDLLDRAGEVIAGI